MESRLPSIGTESGDFTNGLELTSGPIDQPASLDLSRKDPPITKLNTEQQNLVANDRILRIELEDVLRMEREPENISICVKSEPDDLIGSNPRPQSVHHSESELTRTGADTLPIDLKPTDVEIKISTHHEISAFGSGNANFESSACGSQSELSDQHFKCRDCDFVTTTRYKHSIHQQGHYNNKSQQYLCDVCGYQSSHKNDFELHVQTHTGEKPYKCDQCEFETTRERALILHTRIHIIIPKKPPQHPCDLCGFNAASSWGLQKHMQTHTGETVHECNHCNFSTTQLRRLRRHVQTHVGVRRHQCAVCGLQAAHNYSLKRHLKSHASTRNGGTLRKCDQCDFETTQEARFREHVQLTHYDPECLLL